MATALGADSIESEGHDVNEQELRLEAIKAYSDGEKKTNHILRFLDVRYAKMEKNQKNEGMILLN